MDENFTQKASDWIDNGEVLSLAEISDEEELVQKILRAGLRETTSPLVEQVVAA